MASQYDPASIIDIDVIFENYREITVVSQNLDGLAGINSQIDSLCLRKCLDDILVVESYFRPNLRKYVHDLLVDGEFFVHSPFTGAICGVVNSYIFDDFATIFFFCDQGRPFALVASDLSLGLPITNLILLNEKLILTIKPTFWTLKPRHFEVLSLKKVTQFDVVHGRKPVALVVGDSNFAHHAWNELPALQEIVELGLDHGVPLHVFHETLGPINDVLGASFSIEDKMAKGHIYDLHDNRRLIFAAGSQRITNRLLEQICSYARQHADEALLALLADLERRNGGVLWLSVRTRNRTLSNQTEVLSAIICEYLGGRPDRAVIIDGHSLPFDHDRDPEVLRGINEKVVEDDVGTIRNIVEDVRERISDPNIIIRCGDYIYESILLAQECGMYFCHHGTVQHKIGWFAPVPGIVHCNRKVLESRPAHWVAEKSEIAVLPTYVPDDIIGVFEDFTYNDEVQRNLSVENYFINDVSKLLRFFSRFVDSLEDAKSR